MMSFIQCKSSLAVAKQITCTASHPGFSLCAMWLCRELRWSRLLQNILNIQPPPSKKAGLLPYSYKLIRCTNLDQKNNRFISSAKSRIQTCPKRTSCRPLAPLLWTQEQNGRLGSLKEEEVVCTVPQPWHHRLHHSHGQKPVVDMKSGWENSRVSAFLH